MGGFPNFLLVAAGVAIFVLLAVGLLLWKSIFEPNSFDSGSKFHTDATAKKPPRNEEKASSIAEVEPRSHLQSKTVSSAETVNEEDDPAADEQVEISRGLITDQKTVENTGDVSISMDDEE